METINPPFDLRWIGARISDKEWHFHRQLLRRYGIVLAVGQFSQIISDIHSERAQLIKARGARRGIYSVRLKSTGERIYVLAKDGIPRTAWPPSDAIRLTKKAAISRSDRLP